MGKCTCVCSGLVPKPVMRVTDKHAASVQQALQYCQQKFNNLSIQPLHLMIATAICFERKLIKVDNIKILRISFCPQIDHL